MQCGTHGAQLVQQLPGSRAGSQQLLDIVLLGGDGQTLHLDDREEQILETLRNIATLLDAAGTDPAEGLWTLYFKDEQAWQIWRRLEAAGRVCRWPNSATIFGDVCRDDLLFEAEVTLPGP